MIEVGARIVSEPPYGHPPANRARFIFAAPEGETVYNRVVNASQWEVKRR